MHASAGLERRRGWAPLAAAGLLLLGLCSLRFLFHADEQHSWFLGRMFGSACWFRAHFGVPCPNCGMTRSLILAAHGDLVRAFRIEAGGAVMAPAAAIAALVLAMFGVTILRGRLEQARRMRIALRVTVLTGASLTAIVWFSAWAVSVVRSLARG